VKIWVSQFSHDFQKYYKQFLIALHEAQDQKSGPNDAQDEHFQTAMASRYERIGSPSMADSSVHDSL
jgi:hypothetical protein